MTTTTGMTDADRIPCDLLVELAIARSDYGDPVERIDFAERVMGMTVLRGDVPAVSRSYAMEIALHRDRMPTRAERDALTERIAA